MRQTMYIAGLIQNLIILLVKKRVITKVEARKLLLVNEKEIPRILVRKQKKVIE